MTSSADVMSRPCSQGCNARGAVRHLHADDTVRDPMAKRVKALNERREQLKAGITVSTTKRAKLVHQRESTDKMRDTAEEAAGVAG
jgi:hypothetical protein